MRTDMDCRTLGEEKGNYTNSSVRRVREPRGYSTPEQASETSGSGNGKVAVGLLASAGVGVLAGMLLAPEKGKVLRHQVMDSAAKVGDQVTKGFNTTKEKITSWTNKMSHSSSSKGSQAGFAGNVQKSPYTDTTKWSDQEVKNMTDTARRTPGV